MLSKLNAKNVCLIVCLFMIFTLSAQSGYVADYVLPDYLLAGTRSTQLCSDGSVLVFSDWVIHEELHSYSYGVLKYNSNGNLLWSNFDYSHPPYTKNLTFINKDNNDDCYFLVTMMSGESQIQLWKMDSNGNFTHINSSDNISYPNLYLSHAVRLPNGEILAVGKSTLSNFQYTSRACYYRLSASGEILNSVFFDETNSTSSERQLAYQIIAKNNDHYYVACELDSGLSTIIEIDINGNVLNRLTADNFESHGLETSAPTICQNEITGEFLVAYYKKYESVPLNITQEIAVIENDSLRVLFEVGPNILWNIQGMSCIDNYIFLYGKSKESSNGLLMKYSLQGELIWQYEQFGNNYTWFGGDYGTYSPDLVKFGSDGCIYWSWTDYQNIHTIKLLSNGQLSNDNQVINPSLSSISVYPNPGKSQFNIEMVSGIRNSKPQYIEIFNIKGQKVRQLSLSETKNNILNTQWDGKDYHQNECPSGIYFFKSNQNHNIIKKVTKIR